MKYGSCLVRATQVLLITLDTCYGYSLRWHSGNALLHVLLGPHSVRLFGGWSSYRGSSQVNVMMVPTLGSASCDVETGVTLSLFQSSGIEHATAVK